MEYTVGSLADLISGSNTPNKPKVVKKKFEKKTFPSETTSESTSQVVKKKSKRKPSPLNQAQEDSDQSPKKKSKKVKAKGWSVTESPDDVEETTKLKKKKRKLDESETDLAQSTNSVEGSTKLKKKKTMVDESEVDLADSGAEDTEDVGTPTEKSIPTQNDKNAERRVKKKIKEEKRVENPEELARTIFVGNVPIQMHKKKIKNHFKKYGPIESLRFRGIPVADPKTSKKVAAIKKEFHPDRSNVYCYIRFMNKDDALKAEEANGSLFQEHHLRVHCCANKEKPDESKAIFVGNLSFDADEDALWKLFESCGPISHVRIIRDSYTGMGKGFGYVNFETSDAVQMALEMENVKLKDRELRISLSNLVTAKKNKNKNKNKAITKAGKPKSTKPFGRKRDNYKEVQGDGEHRPERPNWTNNNNGFQGAKFSDKKQKFKVNRGALEKKRNIKRIAPIVQ